MGKTGRSTSKHPPGAKPPAGSYGTRAALVYLRQHGAHVRAAVIDGVAPPTESLLLTTAEDGQHAMELIFDDCERDTGCARRYPSQHNSYMAVFSHHHNHGN